MTTECPNIDIAATHRSGATRSDFPPTTGGAKIHGDFMASEPVAESLEPDRLRREPVVDLSRTASGVIPPRRPAEMGVAVTRSMCPSIAVSGPIDLSTAEELRRHLWSASRGGALPRPSS